MKANLDNFSCVVLETPEQRNSMSLTKEGGIRNGSGSLHLKQILLLFRFMNVVLEVEISSKTTQALLSSSNNNVEFK